MINLRGRQAKRSIRQRLSFIVVSLLIVSLAETKLVDAQQIPPQVPGPSKKDAGKMEYGLYEEVLEQLAKGRDEQKVTVIIELGGPLTLKQRRQLKQYEVCIIRIVGVRITARVPYGTLLAVRDLAFVRFIHRPIPALPPGGGG